MKKTKVFIALLFLFSLTKSYGQFKEKHFKKIPNGFSKNYLITHEITIGRRLSYKSFKKGEFISATEKEVKNFMNTMLLGSATYLFDYLKGKYPDFSPEVVKPNGFTTSTFYIKYKLNKGEIFIIRTMDHNKLWIDPYAAEKPENYSILYAFNFQNSNDQKEIENLIAIYAAESKIEIETLKN